MYNVEKYVEQSLRSVLDQQFKDFELIVVDDASSDNSIAIVERFVKSDARIKLIRHEYNQGQGVARNTGVVYACGKYIYFFDSDDLLMPHTFEVLHRAAEQTGAEVVHSTSWFETNEKDDGTFEPRPEYHHSPINSNAWLTRGIALNFSVARKHFFALMHRFYNNFVLRCYKSEELTGDDLINYLVRGMRPMFGESADLAAYFLQGYAMQKVAKENQQRQFFEFLHNHHSSLFPPQK